MFDIFEEFQAFFYIEVLKIYVLKVRSRSEDLARGRFKIHDGKERKGSLVGFSALALAIGLTSTKVS